MKNWFASDSVFNSLYPVRVREVAEKHWTPLPVALKAAAFLAVPGAKILDIGSGSGKFCLAAAHYHPKANFYGIEQRCDLAALCGELKVKLQLTNVFFACDNITHIDFKEYDHFYFYNSFYENIADAQKIDESVLYSEDLYNRYNRYVYRQLSRKPAGTRLVTYHSPGYEIPEDFEMVSSDYDDYLKFWVKM